MPSGGGGGGEAGRGRRRRAPAAGRAAAAAVVALGLLAGLPARAAAQAPDPESAFLARIAAERTAAGHGGLALADDLVAVARRHAATMAAQGRLHHNPELGAQVANWARVGENVGRGPDVDAIHSALMASATHRAEILAPWFSEVGVGVVSSDGALWVTQVFRQPDHAASPSPSPSPSTSPLPSPSPSSPNPAAGPAAAPTTAAPTTAPPTVPPGALPTAPRRRAASPAAAPAPPAAPASPATTALLAGPPPPPGAVEPPAAGRAVALPAVALAPLRVAASTAAPVPPGVVGTGSVAAGLLWAVTAGLARSALARPARRR